MVENDDDWDVQTTEESPENEPEPSLEYEIINYPADITLKGYVDLWDSAELKIPPFQREYIWDQVKASKLVESFLLGLPVPGTFLYKEKAKPGYLVIDGQQRIFSLIRFIKGTFGESTFRLKNVESKYKDKLFSDLSEDEQFRFKGLTLRATIIQQINPKDDTSIYQIFERLNTGGMNLNPMEVRQCVSYGPFIEALKEMNSYSNWRKIIGKPKIDKRLRDVELILRCTALASCWEFYEKPMKGFLNKYAETMRKDSANFVDEIQKFKLSADYILEKLGEKPFHLRGPLNYGALDSMMVCVLLGKKPKDLRKRFDNLISDKEYDIAITYNTSDESAIHKRISKAIEYVAS